MTQEFQKAPLTHETMPAVPVVVHTRYILGVGKCFLTALLVASYSTMHVGYIYVACVHCRELDRQQPMENWSIGRPFDGPLYQPGPFVQVSDRDVHVAGRTNIGIYRVLTCVALGSCGCRAGRNRVHDACRGICLLTTTRAWCMHGSLSKQRTDDALALDEKQNLISACMTFSKFSTWLT